VYQAHGSECLSNQLNTKASKKLGMEVTNQIQLIGGTVGNNLAKYKEGGGKSLSFLPKITKLYMDVAGSKFPSDDSLADLGTDL
jgi:hypothetical protein